MPSRSPAKPKRRSLGFWKSFFLCAAVGIGAGAASFGTLHLAGYTGSFDSSYDAAAAAAAFHPVLNKRLYNWRIYKLANNGRLYDFSTSTDLWAATTTDVTGNTLWPAKTVYPNPGALLPFSRIVAYYGNFSSPAMGILGELPKDEMLARLKAEAEKWRAADPTTPVLPAIDYIAIVAQGSPGADGKYRLRMPDSQIKYAISVANEAHALLFLDVQVGLSDLRAELPYLKQYLELPQVELSIDPEFSMKTSGLGPGRVIGTFDAEDVNFAARFLADIVKSDGLPPKILVVHRFTEEMVTNYKKIEPLPEVQIVMDMDGWGSPEKKLGTYWQVVYKEPVQFSGFKLFYKNDLRPPSTGMLTPEEILKLKPQPSYIQYQ